MSTRLAHKFVVATAFMPAASFRLGAQGNGRLSAIFSHLNITLEALARGVPL